jgi:hypothetical protein
MKLRFLLFLTFLCSLSAIAQLKSPADFLGYEIGTQFSRHADVARYFEHVAANSDMVTYQEYGKTNERRPLTYAVVSAPANQQNIERIRKNNLAQTGIIASDSNGKADKAIVWLSYNVHGNEASSTEASMVTLYELITNKKEWLENTVVIIDPCVNPDGRDRYANWYNQVASSPYDPLQVAAEHHEPWPGGRPNHYLFDLNRDWAWATQVETQQRLKIYNQWMPQIHVDFHEQGINEPYYFAPAAEPFHEIITPFQRDFQTEIGKNHATYFDQEGWLYFTKERFDLLYPSYGDTYPTYMGAIGMTYEQAGNGRAGLGINNDEGFELTLVDRVAHHKATGLSTVEVASRNVEKLNTEFKKYFDNSALKTKSYVLKGNLDNMKSLAALLDQHEITYGFTGKGKASGLRYDGSSKSSMDYDMAMVVSTNQPKGKMVQVLFEPNTKLSTPLTYDITAWNLPTAYGLEAVGSSSLVTANAASPFVTAAPVASSTAAGYISKWNSMEDARFLAALLKADIKVRFSEKPFQNNGTTYNRGSLIITKSDNRTMEGFNATVSKIAATFNRSLDVAASSFSSTGPDFGSPDVKLVIAPRIALLKGERTSSLAYGAAWYFFEQTLEYPVTSIDTDYFASVDLSKFDVLVMPSGSYSGMLNESGMKKVTDFVRSGGKVIAMDNAVSAFAGKDEFSLKSNEASKDSTKTEEKKNDLLIPYASREEAGTDNLITGSIFKTTIDATHPLAFGYDDTYYSLKLGSDSYSYLENGYNVGWIPEDVKNVSGFAGDTAKTKLKNSMIFGEERLGSGSVIYMVDDPLFRAFWQNGKLFFVNAVFLVNNNKPEL